MVFTTLGKAQEYVDSMVVKKYIRAIDREINKLRFIKEPGKRLIRYRKLCRLKSQI